MLRVKRKILLLFFLALISSGLIFKAKEVEAGVGESAVITLVFPPGARATGTGEAFTGVSDDFTATYYNPAGLGLSPLSNSWKVHLLDNKERIVTSLASKKNKAFGERDYIWAGTGKGLIRYEGRLWEDFEIYLVSEGDNLESIANKFVETEDKILLKKVINEICRVNKLDTTKIAKLKTLLRVNKWEDTTKKEITISSLVSKLMGIPSEKISEKEIKEILDSVKELKVDDNIINQISELLKTEPSIEKVTELKIPFSIAVSESVTALLMDKSDNLWVGTKQGLWKYSNKKWKLFTVADGLPSNYITSMAVGPYSEIVIGTDRGVGFFKFGEWKIKADTSSKIPSFYIKTVACARGEMIYAGTEKGLLR
ncbi:MAG: hypothetical protein N2053_04655, partial [Chitinispirillaceae bacterium]|nr:hypothetical protein [Chitinispirillaceae bacterium]